MKIFYKSCLFLLLNYIIICDSFAQEKYIDIFIIAGEYNAIGYSTLTDTIIQDTFKIQEDVLFQMSWNVSKQQQFYSNLTSQIIPGTTSPLGADFFGPELGFAARATQINLTALPIGLIKYGVEVSTLFTEKNNSGLTLSSWDTHSVPEGECWTGLKNAIINGVNKYRNAGYGVNIKGLVWYHGESDGKFEFPVGTIGAKLEQFLDSVKNFLHVNYGTDSQTFSIVLTRPGQYHGSPHSWGHEYEIVKNKSGYIGLVDATPYSNPNSSLYLTGAAMWDLGSAQADQMKLALKGCACMIGYGDVGQLTWPYSSCSGVCKRIPPKVSALDYAFWYYPTNQKPPATSAADYKHEAHFLTGYYGLAFNPQDLSCRFGILNDKMPIANASNRPNSIIHEMPSSIISFEAGSPQGNITAVSMNGVGGSTEDRWSTRDAGKFMNQLNIVNVTYNNDAQLFGYVKIASTPRHFVFTHGITKNITTGMSSINVNVNVTSTVRIRVSGQLLATLTKFTWLIPGQAIRLTDSFGIGWIFIVYEQVNTDTLLTYTPEDGLVATRNVSSPQELLEISLLALPTTAIGSEELKVYLNPASVRITSTLLDKNGGFLSGIWSTPMVAVWSPMHGVFQVPMNAISKAGGVSGQSLNTAPENWELHNLYNRHLITVQTSGQNLTYGSAIIGPVAIPMCFGANNPNGNIGLSITAGIAFFRDSKGEPLGIQIQMSKDWHTCTGCGGSDGNLYYHLYSIPTFSGMGIDEFELTFANSRWGQAHAAQHSQLSLIGYNSRCGGHWQESSISPVGETITYDPDLTLGRAMIDDVRPFLNLGGNDLTQRWAWTGNVGGADFLSYIWNNYTVTGNTKRRLGRVRTDYEAHGPTLTNVGFHGISSDGAIQGNIRTQLASSNDIVRCYYILDYTFLKDVEYYRLAFFQIAADGYMDNGYSKYAYGNELNLTFSGNVSDAWGTASNKFSYANNAARGIPLSGTSPWVLLYKSTKRDATLADWPANIGFIVRSFKATIGDQVITIPHINIGGQSGSQVSFELGLPHNCRDSSDTFCGRFVPAGSHIQAVVEYVVLPAVKSMYYGFMDYMKQMPDSSYDNHLLMMNEAANNTLLVIAQVGLVRRNQPVEIDAAIGLLAADFLLQGGVGWTPITFHGLNRYDGWILQKWDSFSQEWMKIDQSYRGNDFWQTVFNQDALSYSLTYIVPNENLQRYRLINQAIINRIQKNVQDDYKIE